MIAFALMTALASALAGMLVLAGARRGVEPAAGIEADAGARELAELDRLRDRGLIEAADWTAARAEAGRRLLNGPTLAEPRPRATDPRWVLGGVVGAVALAAAIYLTTGSLGAADQPYERRVDEWSQGGETLEPAQIAAVVERVVRERPGDARALTMLGAARFEAGDPIGAASAFRRALEIAPEDAQSWARLGESLVRANDGRVGADAEAAFRQAFDRDPDQLGARYFLGEAALARGDAAAVRALWTPLIAVLDPADPRRADLVRRMPPQMSGAAS